MTAPIESPAADFEAVLASSNPAVVAAYWAGRRDGLRSGWSLGYGAGYAKAERDMEAVWRPAAAAVRALGSLIRHAGAPGTWSVSQYPPAKSADEIKRAAAQSWAEPPARGAA